MNKPKREIPRLSLDGLLSSEGKRQIKNEKINIQGKNTVGLS